MIWTLRVECVRGRFLEEECVRVMEIDAGASLLDLHDAIQASVGFDQDHLFEFFAGRHPRNRQMVFDDTSEWDVVGGSVDMRLDQVFPLPKHLKLYYHFDFGDDWYFEIRRSRTKPKEPAPRVKYPRVIEAIGRKPRQYG